MSSSDSIGPVSATVAVHTDANGMSRFACPNCGRTIRFANSYPLSFHFRRCPKCRWVWSRFPSPDDVGPRAEAIAGQTNPLRVVSSGEPV
jgi:predicted RNA-binding Zn-ribbon protein involved in translation (DUF1610 family)